MEKCTPCKWKSKESRVSLLISDKIGFRINTVSRDKEGHRHYIIIEGSMWEDRKIVNIYASNTGAPQYMRQILTDIKWETGSNTTIVGDFNTPLISMDK